MKQNAEPPDAWVHRLSEYVDNDLSGRERRALEAHLADCATCSDIVADLRRVIDRARDLNTPAVPVRDLWPGIAARLRPRGRERSARWTWSWPPWLTPRLAALTALAGVLLAAVWLWQTTARPGGPSAPAGSPPPPVTARDLTHEPDYERTVAGLERQARARLTLDPHVIEVLDENLASLDVAIANYREALSEDPGDARMRERLADAKERKLQVLRQAVTLAAEGTN